MSSNSSLWPDFSMDFPPGILNEYTFYLIATCSTTVTFPFYVYIFRQNRQRDSRTPIFQVINHLYKVLTRFYPFVCVYVPLSCTFYVAVYGLFFLPLLLLLIKLLEMFHYVNQLLLSFLAIQRFLLYFYPSSEEYLNFSELAMSRVVWCVYVVFLSINGSQYILVFTKYSILASILDPLPFIFVNLLVLSSAILYIPILMSIRKFNHLESAQANHPQRYVLWQLVAMIIGKVVYIVPFVSTIRAPAYTLSSVLATLIHTVEHEAFLMPLITQLAYLFCNHHNLVALAGVITQKASLRRLCCPCAPGAEVQVEERAQIESTV